MTRANTILRLRFGYQWILLHSFFAKDTTIPYGGDDVDDFPPCLTQLTHVRALIDNKCQTDLFTTINQ